MVKKLQLNNELRSLSDSDLKARAQEDMLRLKKLKFAHAISPIENPISIRILRKDVARVQTELKNRVIAQ